MYRSLSPDTAYIVATGHIVLMDFSTSKLGLDRTYTLCGTDSYLAPEVIAQSGD